MKIASTALANLINTGNFFECDCYTLALVGGGPILRYTSADFDVYFGGNTWSSKGPIIDQAGNKPLAHWKVGLDVDTWQMLVAPRLVDPVTQATFPDTIGTLPWLQAAASGALDGATVTVQRAYFAAPPTWPLVPRTNIIPDSAFQILSNWTSSPPGSTFTTNSRLAPDGTMSMLLVTEAAGAGAHDIWTSAPPAITAGAIYTGSYFLAAGTRQYIQVSFGPYAIGFGVVVDTTTWTIVGTGASSGGSYLSSHIQSVGGGVYRVDVTGTIGSTIGHVVAAASPTAAYTPNTAPSCADGSKTWYMWGAQLEVGAYVGPYIPTTVAAVSIAAATPVGMLTIFLGLIADVDLTSFDCTISIQDMRSLLNTNMPHSVYQAQCRHMLYDARCTLVKTSYSNTLTVANPTALNAVTASIIPPAASGSGTYALGRLTFTTGRLTGVTRTIASLNVATFNLFGTLPSLPSIGDQFTVSSGCDKQLATCNLFGNKVNFGGTPFIPAPEITI